MLLSTRQGQEPDILTVGARLQKEIKLSSDFVCDVQLHWSLLLFKRPTVPSEALCSTHCAGKLKLLQPPNLSISLFFSFSLEQIVVEHK